MTGEYLISRFVSDSNCKLEAVSDLAGSIG